MFKNYLKVSIRNLLKYKAISSINIFGLVLGMICSLLILEYVFYERSFDSFHTDADRIYRLAYDRYQNGQLMWQTANSFLPSGPYLQNKFPEVEAYATIRRNYNVTVCFDNEAGEKICHNESKTYFATGNVFNFFSYSLVKGEKSCLIQPFTVVLTEDAAEKYFGKQDPIGKILMVDHKTAYTVTGVIKNIPKNSHLRFDLLFSFASVLANGNDWMLNNWQYDYFHNYIKLKSGVDHEKFSDFAFPQMIKDNYAEHQEKMNEKDVFYLQPLTEIHLHSNIEYETEKPGNAKAVNILFYFSIFFLIIAWINYVNLVTSRATERAKETGIRKTSGATKKSLVMQFFLEAALINLASILITTIIFLTINPIYLQWVNIEAYPLFKSAQFWWYAILFYVLGVTISGIYPAFVLSSFNPVEVLKGVFKNSKQGIMLRQSLVTFQFMLSFLFLLGTIVAYQQVEYLLSKDMGIKYSSTLFIKSPKPEGDATLYDQKVKVLQENLEKHPQISSSTLTTDIPGEEIENWFWCYRKGYDSNDGKAYFRIGVDEQFADFYGVRLLAGRFFSKEHTSDKSALIINESAMKRLGYNKPEEVLNTFVTQGNNERQIIGVVSDFHYKSIKVEPVPTFFNLQGQYKPYINIRYKVNSSSAHDQLLTDLRQIFSQHFPSAPFEYAFAEDKIANDLSSDRAFRLVFGLFSIVAVVIAIIGLSGLLLIYVNQNLKSLLMRKVLGAEHDDVFVWLSRQIIIQLGVALLIGVPLGIWGFDKWISQNYIYHIQFEWYYLAVPSAILIIMASIIVFSQVNRVFNITVTEQLKAE